MKLPIDWIRHTQMIAWKKRTDMSEVEDDLNAACNDRLHRELVKECRRITFLLMAFKGVVFCGFVALLWSAAMYFGN